MKKIVEIEINGKLTDNSVVIFKDNKWIAVDKTVFLNDIYEKIADLERMIIKETENRNEGYLKIAEAIETGTQKIKILLGED